MPVRKLLSGGLWFKAHPGKDLKEFHVKKKTNKHHHIKSQVKWIKV
jgi:hypothetical protein